MAENDFWNMVIQRIPNLGANFKIPILIWRWEDPRGPEAEIKAWPQLGIISLKLYQELRVKSEHPYRNAEALLNALRNYCAGLYRPPEIPHLSEAFRDVLEAKSILEGKGADSEKGKAMEKLTEKWKQFVKP